jgi:NADH-quinone oxidoreductase subunit N
MHSDWAGIIPHMFLAGGGFLILCAGAFWHRRPTWFLFAVALVAALGAAVVAAVYDPVTPDFSSGLDLSGYARYFTALLSAITVIALLFANRYSRVRGIAVDEFYGLTLYAALGMILAAGAVNWLVFFLGLELLSLPLYVIIAVRRDLPASSEAGLKYFLMGAVASAFLTFGIAMLYGFTGTMSIAGSLAADAQVTPGMLLGFGLVLVGIAFKISLVPLHLWTPDVYQAAPAPVTALLATGSKVALFAALLRFSLHSGNALWAYCLPVFWTLAVLNVVVGNVCALGQFHVKRLLAYSSIAQTGYLMMGLVAVKENGAFAVIFYLTVYALMNLGAFGVLGLLSAEKSDLDALDDFRGCGYSHPWQSALLAISLFSLAGFPPTAGFIGKFIIFKVVIQANFVALAIIGILTVIMSIYYYSKVIVWLYMRPSQDEMVLPGPDLSGRFAVGAVLVLTLWLGVAPAPLLGVISRVVSTIQSLL